MFSIDLEPEPDPTLSAEHGEALIYGHITLDDHREAFITPLEFWSAEDYRRHWLEAVRRILVGETVSCLITCIGNPDVLGRLQWWAMYRSGEQVIFQEHLTFLYQDTFVNATDDALPVLAEGFDPTNPYRHVSPRRTEFDEGERPPSEWVLPLSDLEAFARDRGG